MVRNAADDSFFADLIAWVKERQPSKEQLHRKKILLCQERGKRDVPTDIEVYLHATPQDAKIISPFVTTKPTRTQSGVAIIATMTSPSLCPHGACTYCPGGLGSPFGDTPMSYTGTEPSTMRAIRHEYDPYRIIFNRLQQYLILGQFPDKVEHIIQGGTFAAYSLEYQDAYVRQCFQAYNDFSEEFFKKGEDGEVEFLLDHFREFFELPCKVGDPDRMLRLKDKVILIKNRYTQPSSGTLYRSLEQEHIINETAAIRCIGLTIETKPDWGFASHGLEFLRLGCTRVELGVQTVYDDVLQCVNRGHTIADTKKSVQELRDLAFKLNFHIMPGLPTPSGKRIDEQRDLDSIKMIFEDPSFRPDMIKIYPCMVMPGTVLEQQWKSGVYTPLTTAESAHIIVASFKYIPEWCRIMRIQRDIPTRSITTGVDRTNLRQYVDELSIRLGVKCRDMRSREPHGRRVMGEPLMVIREYDASGGREFFISFESPADDVLLGFVRLRFPCVSGLHPSITPTSALIRELHVYGQAVQIGTHDGEKVQHKGFGRQLMAKAEEIAKYHGKNKILVIAGVGVREYYYNLGYVRDGPYVSKTL